MINRIYCGIVLMLTMTVAFDATNAGVMVVASDPIQGPNPVANLATANAFFGNVIDHLGGVAVPNNDDDPEGVNTLSAPFLYSQILTSTFPTWNGLADPTLGWDDGVTVPGAFAGQFGNSVFVPAVITTDADDKVALADIQGSLRWNDPTGTQSSIFTQEIFLCGTGPDCNNDGDMTNDNVLLEYSQENVGIIDDDMDGILETNGDDTLITSGAVTQLVDGLILIGLADRVSFSGLVPDGTNQENIDEALSRLATIGQQDLTVTYSITSRDMESESDTAIVPFIVPEPNSGTLMCGVALAFGLVLGRRRTPVRS